MTSEEIKNALRTCTGRGCADSYCAYAADGDCSGSVMRDALALIEQLEEQIMGMKIQMHGDCGVCKHRSGCQINGRDIAMSKTCYDCMMKESRPNWEYEGLPELPKKGASA